MIRCGGGRVGTVNVPPTASAVAIDEAYAFAYQDFTPAWSRTASCTAISLG